MKKIVYLVGAVVIGVFAIHTFSVLIPFVAVGAVSYTIGHIQGISKQKHLGRKGYDQLYK